MNCKSGDLCLVISGIDCGKSLTVSELLPAGSTIPGREDMPNSPENRFARSLGPIWSTDRELQWYANQQPAEKLPYCPDAFLRPITPDDDMKLAFKTESHLENIESTLADLAKVRKESTRYSG